jgi:hypothetical protein
MQMLAPLLQVNMLHAVQIYKALIYGIAEIARRFLTDDVHHPRCHLAIKFIIAAEYGYLLIGELLDYLEIRCTFLDAQCLGLVASGYYATVIIA